MDDHSTDGSRMVAERYVKSDSRFRSVSLLDPKRYAAAARNCSLEIATGKYINFLDSDDLIAPTKLEKQIDEFIHNPHLDVVGCRYARFISNSILDAYQVLFSPESHWVEFLLANNSVYLWQTGCPLWRVEAIKKIGGWDETISWWDDPELDLRALCYGLNLKRIEEILLFLRRGTQSRLGSRSRLEKHSIVRRAIWKGWHVLEETGQVTEIRRRLCADNFLRFAWTRMKCENFFAGLRDWIRDSRGIGQSWLRTLEGAIILLSNKYRLANYFGGHLRSAYFKHRDELPPPLPYLEGIPISPPEDENSKVIS